VTKRAMVLVTRVACNKEGDGKGCKSNSNEGGGQATAMRAMAIATVKAIMQAMATATRVVGDKKGNGVGGKGNGVGDKGGMQKRWQLGWQKKQW
jgi:hypothetical protein